MACTVDPAPHTKGLKTTQTIPACHLNAEDIVLSSVGERFVSSVTPFPIDDDVQELELEGESGDTVCEHSFAKPLRHTLA